MIKNLKEWILNFINGFCMALADSVPGVSGGTVAFILGFYDKFICSLDGLFRGKMEEKKSALLFLIKLGIGWACGFIIAALVLGSIFNKQIYNISSLFIGFIIFAIPIVIYEEREALKKNYLNVLFALIGIAFVVAITLLNPASGQGISVHVDNLSIGLIAYVFFAAMIAISAMVLPGISGSTLLLIFGLYVPIMSAVKEFLHMNFSYFPILCVFGLGVITGIVLFVGLIRKALEKFRPQTIYVIIGMMIGSLFSIVMGPTTLEVPQAAMSFNTFNILFFIIGGVIIVGLQAFKMFLNKEN